MKIIELKMLQLFHATATFLVIGGADRTRTGVQTNSP
jgi:hypothetical protein